MELFKVIENLYTNQKSDWISNMDDDEVQLIEPFIVQRFLAMNDNLRVQTRWLDKYVYTIPSKMFLSLAWSIIPKQARMPFNKYIKQLDNEEKMSFLFAKIRKQFQLSDNDFNANKTRLLKYIYSNMPDWFSYYGVEKRYWNEFKVDFRLIKNFGVENSTIAQTNTLEAWGI